MRRSRRIVVTLSLVSIAILVAVTPAPAQTPKYGGHLNLMQREDLPQGFAVHETSTIATSFPSMPCFNNLVVFDQTKRAETVDNLVGELAEKWSWQDNYRNLVFLLRKNVKWHDGQPFSSKDVKFTFDMLREAPDAPAKLRINPRKDWYSNVEAVEAPDANTVVFRLKRPQPGLLVMLASGYTPIYAAHVNPASYRTGCIGTGPFKMKEWRKGEFVDYVKNPDYFMKGRPYLDSLRYVVRAESVRPSVSINHFGSRGFAAYAATSAQCQRRCAAFHRVRRGSLAQGAGRPSPCPCRSGFSRDPFGA